MAVVEQRGEQRRRSRHSAATLRQRQRSMLVMQQAGQKPVRLTHRILNPLPTHFDPDRKSVDEGPHHTVAALATLHAPEQHRTEDHIPAPGRAGQHLGPCQMTDARRAYSQHPGALTQTARKLRAQKYTSLPNLRAIAMRIQQTERSCRFFHIPKHPPEKLLMLLPATGCSRRPINCSHRRA